MFGKQWDIPPPPYRGLNVNDLQAVLEKVAEEQDKRATETDAKYESLSILGLLSL